MSNAGRPSLPRNVHLLRGNPSKLSDAELNPYVAIPIEAPTCPQQLGPAARSEWGRIVPHLIAAGLVTHLDRAVLAGYCQAYGEWSLFEARIKKLVKEDGVDGLIDVTPSGYKQISALAQVRDRALDRLLRFAREFGLSPSSRVSATAGQQLSLPGMPDDPMEGFLAAGAPVRNTG